MEAREQAWISWWAVTDKTEKLGLPTAIIRGLLNGWEVELAQHHQATLAPELLRLCNEARPIAATLDQVSEILSEKPRLEKAIADCQRALARMLERKGPLRGRDAQRVKELSNWGWLNDRAVELYRLLASRLTPQRKRVVPGGPTSVRKAPASVTFNQAALKLSAETLNAWPPFAQRHLLELTAADMKRRVQSRLVSSAKVS